MELVYFDQNIWSEITNIYKRDENEYNKIIQKIFSKPDLSVVYSKTNIKETLDRPKAHNIELELKIISEISKNNLILENGEIIFRTPKELFDEIANENYFFTELNKVIETHSPKTDNNIILERLRRIQNNIPSKEAVDQILPTFFDQAKGSDGGDDFSQFELFQKIINKKIYELFRQKATNAQEMILADKYANIVCSKMNQAMNIGRENATVAMNSENGQEFLSKILSVNNDNSWRISTLQGMLGALQFWPDQKKVLGKKGVTVDSDDADHSKNVPFCRIFVSNDKHFRNRIIAASEYLKLETQIFDYRKFIEMLDA